MTQCFSVASAWRSSSVAVLISNDFCYSLLRIGEIWLIWLIYLICIEHSIFSFNFILLAQFIISLILIRSLLIGKVRCWSQVIHMSHLILHLLTLIALLLASVSLHLRRIFQIRFILNLSVQILMSFLRNLILVGHFDIVCWIILYVIALQILLWKLSVRILARRTLSYVERWCCQALAPIRGACCWPNIPRWTHATSTRLVLLSLLKLELWMVLLATWLRVVGSIEHGILIS